MHQFYKFILSWNYLFWTVCLSIIRSLFTVCSAMVYVIQVWRQLSSRTWSCSKAVYKPVWHIPLLSIQWINSWWWTDVLSKTCRVSWQNKFVKLVHLVGFITKKFVMMHGHVNVKKKNSSGQFVWYRKQSCSLVCTQLGWGKWTI